MKARWALGKRRGEKSGSSRSRRCRSAWSWGGGGAWGVMPRHSPAHWNTPNPYLFPLFTHPLPKN